MSGELNRDSNDSGLDPEMVADRLDASMTPTAQFIRDVLDAQSRATSEPTHRVAATFSHEPDAAVLRSVCASALTGHWHREL